MLQERLKYFSSFSIEYKIAKLKSYEEGINNVGKILNDESGR